MLRDMRRTIEGNDHVVKSIGTVGHAQIAHSGGRTFDGDGGQDAQALRNDDEPSRAHSQPNAVWGWRGACFPVAVVPAPGEP
jgi:hypothetical protein